ncbi:autotransporter outer membrane beta-barrel domain-containing protein [Erwinia psidii]|uniref:Autotransporter outer membrane beta-barrel domain-containing protein n=1 Tax=Erwinia psidii TaxID=69224 RepID=A0A3N6TR48_9GAMM|nr:autotransporter outer membrane beta-barrel domain-containing protein [Erwinia psidii]MCX8959472.1 autotransporter outer membrane beta-barrel domain-containing protein [Erwinia psidii]MCX8966558.1 autotransporter outer membrane beta-barrel domain-containing protein [Erwinia psidii]RQM37722.1 autotransporter outer membrane beta-barrel domain-containing protein [Erwinia psidii]
MAICARPFALNFLTLTLFPLSVMADQNWSVTDGTTVEVTEGYDSTDTTIPLYAAGANSQLVTDDNLSFSTTANSTYTAHIRQQAGLTLNNAQLSSGGTNAYGIYLYQNSSLLMEGGSVTTTGNSSNAVQSISSSLSLTDAALSTTGSLSSGIYMSGGTLEADNIKISTSGTSSSSLYITGSASGTLNNVEISQNSTSGSYALALYRSSLTGNQLTVESVSTTMPAVLVGTAGTLTLTDSSITSTYSGIRLIDGSIATLTDIDVVTSGSYAPGIDVNVNASATVQGGSYLTTGNSAHGTWLSHASSTLAITDATFTTSGTSSHAVNGQAGVSVVTNSVLSTSGNYGYGYYSEDQAEGSGLIITTSGAFSYGAMVSAGNMELSDTTITTSGNGGYGLVSMAAGTLTATDVVITTSGTNAAGLYSSDTNTTITLENSTITTSNTSSPAARAMNGASATLLNSTLTTTGEQSVGVSVKEASVITADGITVTTTGTFSPVLQTSLSTLNISNSQLRSTGDSVVLYANTQADGQQSTVTLDNVILTSEQSSAVLAVGTDLELNLQNGTVMTGGDGVAINASAAEDDDGVKTYSTVTVHASDNVSLLGDIIAENDEDVITLVLSDNSQLVGATQNISQLSLDSTSRWVINGDSTVGDLQQDGIITFSSDTGLSSYSLLSTNSASDTSFYTLTVTGDLSGSGEFILRTEMGDDQSPTDSLLVEGNATGDFALTVLNQNGLGALTDMGILLVKVVGDASQATFTQKGSVVAGLYEYFVNRVGENSWYLQSSYNAIESDETADDTDFDTDQTVDTDDIADTWRPEIAGYLMAPYMNAAYGFQSAGNYHARQGAYQKGSAVWGRTYGRHDRYRSGRFSYDINSAFVQLGGDILHNELTNGWQVKAGPMLTLGRIRSSNGDNARTQREGLSAHVGKTETTTYGVGGYFTLWNDDGSYFDSIGQLTRYSNRFNSLTQAKMDSYSVLLSAEVGKPFTVYERIRIEPQFQLMAQYMNISEGYASGVKLKGQNIMTGQLRWGGRLFYDAPTVQPYLKLDVVRQLGSTPAMIVDDLTFRPEVSKGYWQTGAGVTGKVASQLSIFAEASYLRGMKTGLEGYSGNLGVKYHF